MKSEDSPKLDAAASSSNGEEKTPPLAMTYDFVRRPIRPHEDAHDSDSDLDEEEWVDDPAGGYDPLSKLEKNFYFRCVCSLLYSYHASSGILYVVLSLPGILKD